MVENTQVLRNLINYRDRLAEILGFSSYTELDLSKGMIKNLKNLENFFEGLNKYSSKKLQSEINSLLEHMPSDISLLNGKIKPWDYIFLKNIYKEKVL